MGFLGRCIHESVSTGMWICSATLHIHTYPFELISEILPNALISFLPCHLIQINSTDAPKQILHIPKRKTEPLTMHSVELQWGPWDATVCVAVVPQTVPHYFNNNAPLFNNHLSTIHVSTCEYSHTSYVCKSHVLRLLHHSKVWINKL